jgi:hypothetical protein
MPVSARFIADFSNFTQAIDRAQVQLADFSKGAGKVESSLNKMTDSFSGRRIIQEAALMEKAIDAAGGASTLTAGQLQQAGAKATEAAEKMKILGIDVPPGLQKLADTTKHVEQNLSLADRASGLLTGTVAKLAAAFSVSSLIDRAAGALVGMGREAITGAASLVDMSAKTGLSIETLQRFAYVGTQTGVSIEDFSQAAFKLGVKIAGGSGSVKDAVDKLGLSYRDLRALSPDQQFATITAALEAMIDPQERNRIGVELFGKTFSTIAPAIAEGYTRMAAEAKVSSDAQVQALKRAEDAWNAFYKNTVTGVTSWLGTAVIMRNTVKTLTDEQMAAYQALLKGGGDAEGFLLDIARKRLSMVDLQLTADTKQVDSVALYGAALKKAQAEVDALTGEQRKAIGIAEELGTSTDTITTDFNISAGALKLLNEQTKAAEEAVRKHAAEVK